VGGTVIGRPRPRSGSRVAVQDHVLLVEDSPTQALAIRTILTRAGYAVSCAADAEGALRMLREMPFDTVITDLRLPGGSGRDLLRDVLGDPELRSIPVLMLSASGDDQDAIDAIDAGAEDFLAKPVNPVLLLARVRGCLAKHRLARRDRDHARLLELERRRTELLLFDMLPKPIAERMKRGDPQLADRLDDVTVLFADLVGFTAFAASRSAEEVVGTLDLIFSRMDELTAEYGVEKIKTIGDGYMAATGAPTSRRDHATAMLDYALAVRDSLADLDLPGGARPAMRIGIASGPVVAGVLGGRRHQYDLWGDTVNLASRMESHGLPGRIQIAAGTEELVRGRLELEARGDIAVKGRGLVPAWLVKARCIPARRGLLASNQRWAATTSDESRDMMRRVEQELRDLELVDAPTGLLTVRGVLPQLEALWRRAAEEERAVIVFAATWPEDELVNEGDLRGAGTAFNAAFRDGDLLARWAPSTLVMAGIQRAPLVAHLLIERFRERLRVLCSSRVAAAARIELETFFAPRRSSARQLRVFFDACADDAGVR